MNDDEREQTNIQSIADATILTTVKQEISTTQNENYRPSVFMKICQDRHDDCFYFRYVLHH